MFNWTLLAEFGITELSSSGGPTPASVENLVPRNPPPAYNPPDDWLDAVAQTDDGGMFLHYVSDFVGAAHGATTAVQLCACLSPSNTATYHRWLASTGLKFLVVVDPHLPREFSNTESVVDGMRVLLVAADPLEFLSQIDAGPSVLFNDFYSDETFSDEASALCYYRALAMEILRVLKFRNILRGPSIEDGGTPVMTPFGVAALVFGSGVPVAVGFCSGILHCLIPQDEPPENWLAEVGFVATNAESYALGFALLRKREAAG